MMSLRPWKACSSDGYEEARVKCMFAHTSDGDVGTMVWYSDAWMDKEWLVAGAWDLCRNPLEGGKGVVRRYSIEVAIAVETGDVVGDGFSTSRFAKGNRGAKVARLRRVFPPTRHRHPFFPEREVDRLVQKRLRGAVCAGAGAGAGWCC